MARFPSAKENGSRLGTAAGGEPERGYGWLPAVIPANARRFRVTDQTLAAGLAVAGAEITERAPDVEIGRTRKLRGDAAVSVAVLGRHPGGGDRPLPLRAARRLLNSLRLRVTARRARRAVARLGYANVDVLTWDYHQNLRNHTSGTRASHRALQEYLPERALVVGRRAPQTPLLIEAVLSEATRAVGMPLQPYPPSIRTGLLIADTGQGMLRTAVGFGSMQIRRQRAALAALRDFGASPLVSERIPWDLGGGRCGLAEWSLERKLPGSRAGHPVRRRLLADCVDFLVALHACTRTGTARSTLVEQARGVARVARSEDARALEALAERLEAELADVPRGFAHGDFFHGNLLVESGRLVGVVDWDGAGPGRLPLIDLLHLRHATLALPDNEWGPRLVEQLLPWAGAGGDEVLRDYCRRLGLSFDSGQLEALTLGYWLDRVSSQLRSHAHRFGQPLWLERNITLVLNAVT